MKKSILLIAVALIFVACGNTQKQNADNTVQAETSNEPVFALDDLLAQADNFVDKEVHVKGYITHTCKHSGRRCFVVGESQKYSIRVEAKGNIGGFNRELIGSEIEITGTLREKRLSSKEIDDIEKAIETKKINLDGSAEACDAETANVENMRKLMKDQGKDYFSIYSIDGEDFIELK